MYVIEAKSGNSFPVKVSAATLGDLVEIDLLSSWSFKWTQEHEKQVVKQVMHRNGSEFVLALMSYVIKRGFLEIILLEVVPSCRGRKKKFERIAGNMLAFACRASMRAGSDGFVALTPKTVLWQHYIDQYGARPAAGNRLMFDADTAELLISKYI